MFKKLRKIATVKLGGSLIFYLAWLYSLTFRLKVYHEDEWLDYLEKGGKVLICCWHQQFFIGVRLINRYQKYSPSVMISKSTDGDIASRVAEAAKVYPVRGSSSRDGGQALKEMVARLKDGCLAAHLLDGPRGPAGVVKAGAIAIAAESGAVIVPAFVDSDRTWYLRSWDQYMIPKPFARVTVTFCPMISMPPIRDSHDFESRRQHLENTLQPHLKR